MKKECFKCKETKQLDEFYKHPEMKDGHVNKCKKCSKKDNTENRNKNREYYIEYDRKRNQLPHRKKAKKKYNKKTICSTREYRRKYYHKNKEKYAEYRKNNPPDYKQKSKDFRENNPEKYNACYKLNNAVTSGKINREPCKFCGETKNIHGHHHDYSKPLDVIWLCIKCHNKLHRYLKMLS